MHYIDYNERNLYYKHKNKIYRMYIDYKIDKLNKRFINYETQKIGCVNGFDLDKEQKEAVVSNEINNLIIAGAGSGKTLTIVGKINYLINRGVKPSEILCISFTNDSCISLKNKISYDIEVLTFHKLALKILKDYHYTICSSNMLNYVVDEYFNSIILDSEDMMRQVIERFDIKNIVGIKSKYLEVIKRKEFINLKKVIITFINLFKANNYNLNKFIDIDNKKHHNLLRIIIDIYILYNQELSSQGKIDFDDMISLAIDEINKNGIKDRYKYIIIDEFQDTSIVRMQLIKSIVNKTGAKVFAVGDDFQSIYKFTGCNLDLFINFSNYFGYTKIIKLTHTYRNSQQLINSASKFVLKNKRQISKKMVSNIKIDKPIKLVNESNNVLEKIINILIDKGSKDILIVGRNNNDINKYINSNFIIDKDKITYRENKVSIRYLTVHRSKGLEAEYVIIINLYNDVLGFPCKLKNDDILDLINEKDKFLYEEERRLFYVALTRTKKDIYLICPLNLSIFVQELKRDSSKYIEWLDL